MTPTETSVVSQQLIEYAVRQRYSPFPELSMEVLSQQLNLFRVGDLRGAARTWEIMIERDGELAGPVFKRCADAARRPWDIIKTEESAEADADAEALRYFYNHLMTTSVLEQDERGGIELLLSQMMSCVAHRYSAHEMILRVSNAGKRQVTAEFRHCPVWFFEARRGRLAFLSNLFDLYGQPMEDGQWLRLVGPGHMRPCSMAYAIKHFPLRDWLFFCSRFGLPGIHGQTDAPVDSKEWNEFAAALKQFANGWITQTNKGASINLIEAAKGGGELPFKELVERGDRMYARLFRGGDLSTQSRGGDANGASLQDEEKDILLEGDCRLLSGALNLGVDTPIIDWLFGREPKAFFTLMPPKRPDTTKEIAAMEFLSQHGGRVAVATAHERLQIPQAPEDEEILVASTKPAFGPAGAPGSDPLANSRSLRRVLANAGQQAALAGNKATLAVVHQARTQLAAATLKEVGPLRARFTALDAITEEVAWRSEAQRLANDLRDPASPLRRELNDVKSSAAVLVEALSAGFANGFAAGSPTPA